MQKIQQFLIINDLFIFSLLVLFFIGFLIYDYELIGIKEPFIHIPKDFKVFFEILPLILFSLLVNLLIKYRLVDRNLRYFSKKILVRYFDDNSPSDSISIKVLSMLHSKFINI